MLLLRRFYQEGYAFSYSKFPITNNKETFRGATTEPCPETLIMTVLENIAMWDFQSLYPNAIISCNLGIDSLRDEDDGNCYAVNLNFVDQYLVDAVKTKMLQDGHKATHQELSLLESDQTPRTAYFSKTPSLYATIIAEILQKRLDVKAQMKHVDAAAKE
jgi:DNA polymerase elongation subunit (family B)